MNFKVYNIFCNKYFCVLIIVIFYYDLFLIYKKIKFFRNFYEFFFVVLLVGGTYFLFRGSEVSCGFLEGIYFF